MKQKNEQQYSASSICYAIATIHRHLVKNSAITGLNLHNQATFPTFWEMAQYQNDCYIIGFVKREDEGFTVYIYRSKTNQRGAFGSRGNADKILIPYNKEIISYYEKYISSCPRNADFEFYLQEKDDEDSCNRKIVSHTGRKIVVQTLESLGETTLNIRKQSRHRSNESIRPYLSTGKKEQLHMMEHLAESLISDNSKSQQKFQEIT
ncbi:unnamed protein product [Rhizophagus irregularis]|nr:unnamed protein product [Rhizophagus irregularis]